MKIIDVRTLAYELYKIDWMRRISADRLMDFVKQYYDDTKVDLADVADIEDVLEEFGFDGELYACYDEFVESEYRDKAYMKALLNDAQYAEYEADIAEDYDKAAKAGKMLADAERLLELLRAHGFEFKDAGALLAYKGTWIDLDGHEPPEKGKRTTEEAFCDDYAEVLRLGKALGIKIPKDAYYW